MSTDDKLDREIKRKITTAFLVTNTIFEDTLQAVCIKHGVGVISYFSLASGFLTGKYRSEADLAKSARGQGVKKYLTERGFRILAALDSVGKEHKMLNQNVLIEIGAAMALYGRKFILLVEDGATLPSNLQGLYEVRYEGEKLDYDSTMKLLKAFADFRG